MAKGRNQHVVPRDGGWAVKPEGGQRASSIHGTQREAIDRGRKASRNQHSEFFVQDRTAESASGTATVTTQSADGLKPCVPTVQARQT
jgi:hypothetical protein